MASTKNILVTGAAGFIGWRFVQSALASCWNPICVDTLSNFHTHAEHQPWNEALTLVDRDALDAWLVSSPPLDGIVHLGACTDTMLTDRSTFKQLNLEYTKMLWHYATASQIPFVYASSAATYGARESDFSDDETYLPSLIPLNPYGESKQQFDLWALEQEHAGMTPPFWSGFKFFNVYGFGERHKGRMASVFLQAFDQISATGKVRLFKSERSDIPDGQQTRDFVHVRDAVKVLHFALSKPIKRGIYNLGTGDARSFLNLAQIAFRTLEKPENIEYIAMPRELADTYQYVTQADISKLRLAGYQEPFDSLEQGGAIYMKQLQHFRRTQTRPKLL